VKVIQEAAMKEWMNFEVDKSWEIVILREDSVRILILDDSILMVNYLHSRVR
jgi:hypothetical protein